MLRAFIFSHDGAYGVAWGWYYCDDDCPENGAHGPFETEREARQHAEDRGYEAD